MTYVICLNEIEDMSVFHTEIRQLFKLMKHRGDSKTIRELIENDTDYNDLNEDTLYTLSIVTERPKLWEEREKYLRKEEGEVSYNMFLAFDEIEAEEREKGRQEGENLLATLINKMLSTGRDKDIPRVTTDIPFRESLYIEYGLKKS